MVDGEEGDRMKLLKEWRIWLLVLIVVGSIFAVSPNPWASGVVVKNVKGDSPFFNEIMPGEKISVINERKIDSVEDFLKFENYTGMMRVFHNGKLTLKEVKNGPGFSVTSAKKSNLVFGMDLVGGTRVLLAPEGIEGMNETDKNLLVDRIIATLQTRMNVYGLKEIKFQAVRDVEGRRYVQVEVAGATKEEIDTLLGKQGNFEAYIPRKISFGEKLGVGNKSYVVEKSDDKINVDDKTLGVNDSVVLNGVEFKVWNITNETVVTAGKVYEGDDIKHVYFDPQHSYVRKYAGGYEFAFQILVSDKGAEKFARVTKDISVTVDPKTGERYLESPIDLFLDKKLVSSLRISASLAGKSYSTPQITGGAKTKDKCVEEERRLQSILESGALPVKLKMVKVDTISPELGAKFLKGAAIAGLSAVIVVSVVIFIRYRNWKIAIPVLITLLSEITIILGVASLIHWTIDLPAIAGLVAAVGTGVDDQIVITDEVSFGKEKVYSLRERIKRAFFIIFGSAATTIAAMLPLMFIGIGVMRGFAITTTIGVLVGIFITRPAYGKIIEELELI